VSEVRGGGHADDCDLWEDCMECGGCDCGLSERTCTGPGCYSREAAEQERDELGYPSEVW
jgi:hypothetical protein